MNSEMNTSMQSRRLVGGGGGGNGTPESEFSNFECYQNYTAPEVFVQGLAGIVNQGDVEIIVRAQKQMLQRFEKTNEMLLNCNALSNGRLKAANDDFKAYGKVIIDMKKDLDYIFKKIRTIKSKVTNQYPEAVKQMEQKKKNVFSEEADEDDDGNGECNGNRSDATETKKTKSNANDSSSTVNYVQMKPSSEEKRESKVNDGKSFDESTDNESSDCTTDT